MVKIGTDIVEIARIKQAVQRHGQSFLDRVFTLREQEDCLGRQNPYPSLATRFAGKEAVMKALGKGLAGGIRWTDVEICRDGGGKPVVLLKGKAAQICAGLGIAGVEISLSHSREYALATAIAFGKIKGTDEGEKR